MTNKAHVVEQVFYLPNHPIETTPLFISKNVAYRYQKALNMGHEEPVNIGVHSYNGFKSQGSSYDMGRTTLVHLPVADIAVYIAPENTLLIAPIGEKRGFQIPTGFYAKGFAFWAEWNKRYDLLLTQDDVKKRFPHGKSHLVPILDLEARTEQP